MNDKKRKKINEAKKLISEGLNIISAILENEQESLDNTPDNLQNGDRYCRLETIIELLEESVEYGEKMIDNIEEASA